VVLESGNDGECFRACFLGLFSKFSNKELCREPLGDALSEIECIALLCPT
jgi:hypothetical protein